MQKTLTLHTVFNQDKELCAIFHGSGLLNLDTLAKGPRDYTRLKGIVSAVIQDQDVLSYEYSFNADDAIDEYTVTDIRNAIKTIEAGDWDAMLNLKLDTVRVSLPRDNANVNVSIREGVCIIKDSFPMRALSLLEPMTSRKGFIVDCLLTKELGAALVFGRESDCIALRQQAKLKGRLNPGELA